MKKLFIILLIALIIIFLALKSTYDLGYFYGNDSYTKLEIRNGKTGSLIVVTKPEVVNNFINQTRNLRIIKVHSLSSTNKVGFTYFIDFYNNDYKKLRITFLGGNVTINDHKFYLLNGVSKIDEFINSQQE